MNDKRRAAAAAKYAPILEAVDRLAAINAPNGAGGAPSGADWMAQWNARSQANYDEAGKALLAQQAAPVNRSPVTLGPFPKAAGKAAPAAPKSAEQLAAAFAQAKQAAASRGSRSAPSRLSPDQLAANAAATASRRDAERDARFQRKLMAQDARAFKRMAGMGYRDPITMMPAVSPQEQFDMQMAISGMQHGQRMDVDQMGLQRQKLSEMGRQFNVGNARDLAALQVQKQLGQGEIDARRFGIQAQERADTGRTNMMRDTDMARTKAMQETAAAQNLTNQKQIESEQLRELERIAAEKIIAERNAAAQEALAKEQYGAQRYATDAQKEVGMTGLQNERDLRTQEMMNQNQQFTDSMNYSERIAKQQMENQLKSMGYDYNLGLLDAQNKNRAIDVQNLGQKLDYNLGMAGVQSQNQLGMGQLQNQRYGMDLENTTTNRQMGMADALERERIRQVAEQFNSNMGQRQREAEMANSLAMHELTGNLDYRNKALEQQGEQFGMQFGLDSQTAARAHEIARMNANQQARALAADIESKQFRDQLAGRELDQQGKQFTAQNRLDRDVLNAETAYRRRALSAETQAAINQLELEFAKTRGTVSEQDKLAFATLQEAGRPDLFDEYRSGSPVGKLLDQAKRTVTPEIRQEILAASGGSYENVLTSLRTRGLSEEELAREFEVITNLNYKDYEKLKERNFFARLLQGSLPELAVPGTIVE